jgi:hypothetical protein
MTAGDLAVVLGTVLCSLGFAALIVVLMRVLDTLRSLRSEVESLRNETRPLIAEMQVSTAEARNDLDRFDRVLGSAEAISDAVSGSGRVARVALSTPMIKAAGLATGTSRVVRRLRGSDHKALPKRATAAGAVAADDDRRDRRRPDRGR